VIEYVCGPQDKVKNDQHLLKLQTVMYVLLLLLLLRFISLPPSLNTHAHTQQNVLCTVCVHVSEQYPKIVNLFWLNQHLFHFEKQQGQVPANSSATASADADSLQRSLHLDEFQQHQSQLQPNLLPTPSLALHWLLAVANIIKLYLHVWCASY
jgi:hypothetical protein